MARFDQVRGVSDEERALAFANIKKAARAYGVAVNEADWKKLGRRPSTGRPASARRASARRAAATRSRRGTGKGNTPGRRRGVRAEATRRAKSGKAKGGTTTS